MDIRRAKHQIANDTVDDHDHDTMRKTTKSKFSLNIFLIRFLVRNPPLHFQSILSFSYLFPFLYFMNSIDYLEVPI